MVESSCAQCHSASGISSLLSAVAALPAGGFTTTSFPPSAFRVDLRQYTTSDLAEEPHIEAGMPTEQAWVLHELNQLGALLAEDVPPDFTSEERLDAFALFSGGGYTEGCELLEKVELGRGLDPEGMPPPWAAPLMGLLMESGFADPSGQGVTRCRPTPKGCWVGRARAPRPDARCRLC
ncbi:MAG: hypothetical protein K8H88_13490, partial [Sandaracinaceae bacterium]|nr:hypothetical protein [Sandaracinaceae bacterium]